MYASTKISSNNTMFSRFVALSYILFFLFVPITKSVSYIGWLFPIVLYVGHILYAYSFISVIKMLLKSPLTYMFIYLVLLNWFHDHAFVSTQVEVKLLGYAMVMLSTRYFLKEKIITPTFLIIAFSAVACILIMDGYWQYFIGKDIFLNRGFLPGHIRGVMEHHNSFGLMMLFSLMVFS